MSSKSLLVGIALVGVIAQTSSSTVSAQPSTKEPTALETQETQEEIPRPGLLRLLAGDKTTFANNDWVTKDTKKSGRDEKDQSEKPVVHIVKPRESLTKIATQHKTTWLRLWQKNTSISHPDELITDAKIIIPDDNEKLKMRALPKPPVPEKPLEKLSSNPSRSDSQPRNNAPRANRVATSRAMSGSSAGNRYTPGYCTWYVKNKRPDLPNSLGNADTWVSRAAAQGLATGSTPRVGAVGQRGMHVAYVERVNPDGTIFVSEMNHKGLWIISSRTVPADYFTYVY